MNFFNPDDLSKHIQRTMAFYHPKCIDEKGGFFHYFRDDGSIYNRTHRHLVSSTRFVFTYARYASHFDEPEYLKWAVHGLNYLEAFHFQKNYQGYAWTLQDGRLEDGTNHNYGLAFVLLAYATALKAGIENARPHLYRVHSLQSEHFWEEAWSLYADEANERWEVGSYRGQNSNMHSCEALIAAYEATGDRLFLNRALQVAEGICVRQAIPENKLVWEHYDSNWRIDMDYNRDNPRHMFRPWGFQTGHQTEWAKLLILLESHAPEQHWLRPKAEHLFQSAMRYGWDEKFGGLVYGFATEHHVCDSDKYFWVQAESLAAAALLGQRTQDPLYWQWYARIWEYSWKYFVDHKYGAWYRILAGDNRAYSDEKSPAGKVDYHTMGACYDMIRSLSKHSAPIIPTTVGSLKV